MMESRNVKESSLKYMFDQLVSRDKELDSAYSKIMQSSLEKLLETMRQQSADFEALYNGIYYGGSFYDNLAVGKIRHEFDWEVIYKIPAKFITIKQCEGNFMPLEVDRNHSKKFERILDDNKLSSEKMKQVLKTAADRAISTLKNTITLPNNVAVNVSRSDKVPYTLELIPQGGKYKSTVEVDLLPALKLPTSKLPEKLKNRIQKIENSTCTKKVDEFLAVAMPTVHKDKLQIDFPRLARKMLSDRPSAKMAIRLVKQERNEKGGPMNKIRSHAIKMAALHEVYKNPSLEHWHEAKLADRHRDLRSSMQGYLERGEMIDIFYPEMNMMDRINSATVKDQVARYLDGSANNFLEPSKTFICATGQCDKYFATSEASRRHALDKHQPRVKTIICATGQCDKYFATSKVSRRHALKKHQKTIICATGQCDKYFATSKASRRHALDKHQTQNFQVEKSKSKRKNKSKGKLLQPAKTIICATGQCDKYFATSGGSHQHVLDNH